MIVVSTTTPRANISESRLDNVTLRGRAHSLSAWFVLAPRFVMGFAFLYAELSGLLGPEPFSVQGSLLGAVPATVVRSLSCSSG